MNKKKIFRSVLAFLCCTSVLLGTLEIGVQPVQAIDTTTESSGETTEKLPTHFEYATPLQFGMVYGTYRGEDVDDNYGESGSYKKPLSSMHQALFETKITFGENTRFIYMRQETNEWAGLTFLMYGDEIWLQNNLTNGEIWVNGSKTERFMLQPSVAIEDETSFINLQFTLSISTEFVANDPDNELNDMKIGVWFNHKLYEETYIYIKDCKDIAKQGLYLYRPGSNSIILEPAVSTNKQATEESYNLADGPYLVIGNGTILVNDNKVENGTALTEPGRYQIISENGEFVRNVTLRNDGTKSTELTYEENVMPIVGYHGPTSETDSRGNKHHTLTEQSYKLLAEAGFNLISKIEKNWDTTSERADIIESLEYAQQYNMGLYIWDGRLNDSSLDQKMIAELLADYSQYDSFKGIYVIDEPRTEDYAADVDGHGYMSTYATQAKEINKYCNLNAYVNLYPLGMNGDYSSYIAEYFDTMSPKFLSYDNYVYGRQYSSATGTVQAVGSHASYFENLSIIKEQAENKGVPFWVAIQAGNNWNVGSNTEGMITENASPTRAELLWNVNTSLAYGAKAIQYFPLVQPAYFAYEPNNGYDYNRNGVLGANGEPTDWYADVKEANKQIRFVDEYLLNAESRGVLAVGRTTQQNTQINTTSFEGVLQSISVKTSNWLENLLLTNGAIVGVFDYQGTDMLYVVNDNTSKEQTFTLKLSESRAYSLLQDGVTSHHEGQEFELTIPAGEAVLVLLQEYVPTYGGMSCVSPEDFGLEYKLYESMGEDYRSCKKLTTMDNVLFKTQITLGESTQIRYLRTAGNEWAGLSFVLQQTGQIALNNHLTENEFYAGDKRYNAYNGFFFKPEVAFADDSITSFEDYPFYLTVTTEYVDYDNGGNCNDVKLGVYFNDKLYNDTYFYICDGADDCISNLFLYRQGEGGITLAAPIVYGTELVPEITDSIAMNYVTVLEGAVTETPTMTFEMNGKVLEDVPGALKEVGGSKYAFVYPEVMAQNMADTVKATLCVGTYTKTYECSMLEYCAYVLNQEASGELIGKTYSVKKINALKDLLVDLVQYGAWVQQYRGMSADGENLLTKKLETLVTNYLIYDEADIDSLENLSGSTKKLEMESGVVDTTSYTWKNVSLVLGNKAKLCYRFTSNAENVSNLKVKAMIHSEEYELEVKETGEAGVYSVEFDEIYAYEYAEPISVRFYQVADGKETQVGKTIYYSVNSYLYAMRNYVDEQASLGNLLLAIHHYGTAAVKYHSMR